MKMNIPVSILYEQMKKTLNDAAIKAQTESGLPVFLVSAALKEILCKYETDAKLELVKDYQSLLSKINKEEQNAESLSDPN